MASSLPLDASSPETPLVSRVGAGSVAESTGITRFEYAVTGCEMLADLLVVVIAAVCSYGIYRYFGLGKHLQYETREHLAMVFGFGVFFVLMLDRDGDYYRGNSLLTPPNLRQAVTATAFF